MKGSKRGGQYPGTCGNGSLGPGISSYCPHQINIMGPNRCIISSCFITSRDTVMPTFLWVPSLWPILKHLHREQEHFASGLSDTDHYWEAWKLWDHDSNMLLLVIPWALLILENKNKTIYGISAVFLKMKLSTIVPCTAPWRSIQLQHWWLTHFFFMNLKLGETSNGVFLLITQIKLPP